MDLQVYTKIYRRKL